MATLNRTILTLFRLYWRTARSLLFLIHTQRLSRRPSLYVDVFSPYLRIRFLTPQALIVASCISLVATVGLLAAIAVCSNSILYLPRPNVLQKDVCVQYARCQKPKYVCADACRFLFCITTPQ